MHLSRTFDAPFVHLDAPFVHLSCTFRAPLFFSHSPFSAQKWAKKWGKKAKSGEAKRASTLEISEKNEFPENGK
jgi:hypothetical protein